MNGIVKEIGNYKLVVDEKEGIVLENEEKVFRGSWQQACSEFANLAGTCTKEFCKKTGS